MRHGLTASEFAAFHRPALERDELRHSGLLSILARMAADEHFAIRHWTLGEAGACAVQTPGQLIVLGHLTESQCRELATETCTIDYSGVVGSDQAPTSFVRCASEAGIQFLAPVPLQTLVLNEAPRSPGADGAARLAGPSDESVLMDWTEAFVAEAVPHDPRPQRDAISKMVAEQRTTFWMVDHAPVSMATIMRRMSRSAAISLVYTPPALRGRGYAGAVTAATAERIFAEGKSSACLNVDLRNPYSTRCYAKIGFKPYCDIRHFPRARTV